MPGGGPAVLVTVDKDNGGGEIVVMLDDVLQVGETFAALVLGGMTGRIGVVDGVDDVAPSKRLILVSAHPGSGGNEVMSCTYSARSLLTHDVSSEASLAITMTRSLGTIMGVVS
jgi:hypothetical protein